LRHLVLLPADVLCSGRAVEGPAGFWPVRLASISMRGLGLVATQTLMFLFVGIGGSAPVGQRLGDAYGGVLAEGRLLIRAGLAVHDG
jgi:hypothetical protein